MKNNKHKFWREWVLGPVIALMIIAPFKSAIADWNWVPSGSMKPSIFEGELALVNKLAYDLKVPFTTIHLSTWGNPERGDVVVFYSPKDGTRLVKRVIGLPGDTIEMRDEVLYVNGTAERYSPADATPFLPGIFEDQHPLVVIEHLPECDHYVMALPSRGAMRTFGPLVVPKGEYFMMGDSRDNSNDSRFIGAVPREKILGRVPRVLLSFDPSRYFLPRPQRFLKPMKIVRG